MTGKRAEAFTHSVNPGDRDAEGGAAQASCGTGREALVILAPEVFQDLVRRVRIVLAEEDMVFSIEEDNLLTRRSGDTVGSPALASDSLHRTRHYSVQLR